MAEDTLENMQVETALHRQTLRNRNNQRTFRARKQQYIQELEAQVEECRKEKLQATKEMQAAAVAVASENELLREYIRMSLHHTDQDIDMILGHLRQADSRVRCKSQVELRHNYQSQSTTLPKFVDGGNSSPINRETNRVAESLGPHYSMTKSLSQGHGTSRATIENPAMGCSPARPEDPVSSHERANALADASGVAAASAQEPQEPTDNRISPASPPKPKDTMSCEEAAEIIADLRLQPTEGIRQELGCVSTMSCYVKNTEVMQILSG